jgi:hypothetical protein
MASNRYILILAVAAVAILAALPLLLPLVGVDSDDLSRDVADTAHLAWWTGGLSMFALMMWSAGAGMCALAAAAIRATSRDQARFLAATAALLGFLALDDALQLHETAGPEVGIPELAAYGVIAALAAWWGIRFRRELLASRAWLLLGVGGLFAASLFSDVFTLGPTAAEDWLKNSGLAILLLWCADTALLSLRRAPASVAADQPVELPPSPLRPVAQRLGLPVDREQSSLSAPRPKREPEDATPRPTR